MGRGVYFADVQFRLEGFKPSCTVKHSRSIPESTYESDVRRPRVGTGERVEPECILI